MRRPSRRRAVQVAGLLAIGCLLVGGLSGCGGLKRGGTASDAPDDELMALRFRVATHPDDMRARERLGFLEMEAGRPGATLREYETVRRYGQLSQDRLDVLAHLYEVRFHERMSVDDPLAYEDAERAMAIELPASGGLAPEINRSTLADAYALAALAEFRRANQWSLPKALTWLEKVRAQRPEDRRLALLDPQGAALADLGEAARWLWAGDARRAAQNALEVYVGRGGREPAILELFVAARGWWGAADARYRLDRYVRLELASRGVSVCPASATPFDVGCRSTLWSVATGKGDVAARVRARARAAGWYMAGDRLTAEDARAWVLLAVRGALAGEMGAVEAVRQRIDVAAAARLEPDELGAASMLIWRALGNDKKALAALERVLGDRNLKLTADGATAEGTDVASDEAMDGDRLLVGFELARLRQRGAASALAMVSEQRERKILMQVSTGPLVAELSTVRQVVRYSELLANIERSSGEPPAISIDTQLAGVANAYWQEPAVGDRKAREYADGDAYTGGRAASLGYLFTALGDTARARSWWERAVELSPRHNKFLFELAMACAATGDLARARVHLTTVIADSGDAGGTAMHAARLLVDMGHDLEAIHMAKLAISVTAPVERPAIARFASEAMERLGRTRDALMLRSTVPASSRTVPRGPAGGPPDDPTDVDQVLAWVATREPADKMARTVLLRSLAWHDDRTMRVRAALLERLPLEDPLFEYFGAELVQRFGSFLRVRMVLEGVDTDGARRAAQAVARALDSRDRGALRRLLARWRARSRPGSVF